ncbi:MAG: purine-nucleoside phosphorylase [Bacillota bacterium]|nr:purine-nucleoside phosphorylase [Bacillota bacterium]
MSETPSVPTPHIEAPRDAVAPRILMPGDPLRAAFIAENYLSDVKRFNAVRNMLGFTGYHRGVPVSVMGSGMGMPSMGIYSYELFHFYGAEQIIRVGSAGAYRQDLELMDLVAAIGAATNSSYEEQFGMPGRCCPTADFGLLRRAVAAAEERGWPIRVGNVLSSDTFYCADETAAARWARMGILAVEMEAAALYLNAAWAGRQALALLSISDHVFRGTALSAAERQTTFTRMMEVALATF